MNATTTPLAVADPINAIALPICAILAILLTYLPLQAFLTIKNFPAICIIVIVDVQNLFNAINAIVWPSDNPETWWKGYGLCDIQTWLKYPLSLAISCSLCCFAKGMADALNTNKVNLHQTCAWKRRKLMKEAAFCWTAPLIQLLLYYIVTNGRYNIYPVFGCSCQVDNSWPTAVILYIWNPIFSFVNGIFAGKFFIHSSNNRALYSQVSVKILMGLYNYREGNGRTLASNNSGMPARKLMKLILIALILLVIYLPIQLLFIIRDWPTSLESYSWTGVHNPATWSPIYFFPTYSFPALQYTGWTPVGASAVMFIFFGFTDHAIDLYRSWLVKLGFGKFWPSLLKPRRQSRGSGTWTTISRFSSKLDLIAKAVNYFEGGASRKSSQTTATRGQDAEIS
jgi:pheromone a factor receptor